jgi:hypothetical protein
MVAPSVFAKETYISDSNPADCLKAFLMAVPMIFPLAILEVTANNEGPEPEREHPSAPAFSADCLT